MMHLSFTTNTIRDLLNKRDTLLMQKVSTQSWKQFLPIVLAWVAVHKSQGTPKPYFNGFQIWLCELDADLVLCLISQEVWGSMHAKAHSKAMIQERLKTCHTQRVGNGW